MIEIQLTKGYVAIVDDEDADLAELKWHTVVSGGCAYARRGKTKKTSIHGRLHNVIFSRVIGREIQISELVDHINGDSLNNTRENLRFCTVTQNAQNKRLSKRNKLGFKGVSAYADNKYPFQAQIYVDGKPIRLGKFTTIPEAFAAYCEAGRKHFGEFFRAA